MNYELIYMIVRTARTWMDAYRESKRLIDLIISLMEIEDLDVDL